MVKPRRSTHRSPARFLGRVIDGALAAPFPGFVDPCSPCERKTPPGGETWLREIKHDGYRAQVQFSDGAARIYTAREDEWAARMPIIAASVQALPVNNVILDGELVAIDAKGQAMVFELPAARPAKPTRVTARLVYYAYDLLYLDGFDLRGAGLLDRKRVLAALLDNTTGEQRIKYVDHIAGDGKVVLQHACKLGLAGIVSKRADALYHSGRCTDWITTTCIAEREG